MITDRFDHYVLFMKRVLTSSRALEPRHLFLVIDAYLNPVMYDQCDFYLREHEGKGVYPIRAHRHILQTPPVLCCVYLLQD